MQHRRINHIFKACVRDFQLNLTGLTVYTEAAIPETPTTGAVTTQTVVDRIGSIPPDDPLTIYFVGSAQDVGEFRLSDTQLLDANALGSALTVSRRSGPTVLIIDCNYAGAVASLIRSAAGGNPNLLLIASTGAGPKNVALFGTLPNSVQPFSFSDLFFDRLTTGESFVSAFAEASDWLSRVQGPVRVQIPQTLPAPIPALFEEFTIGSAYTPDLMDRGVPDNVQPVIFSGDQTREITRGDPLTLAARVDDESTAPGLLRVLAHVSPKDEPERFKEYPLQYDDQQKRYAAAIPNSPKSVFGPTFLTQSYLVSIFAEDDSSNSGKPFVTSVNVVRAPWSVRMSDVNADGIVDSEDIYILREQWHQIADRDASDDGVWTPIDLLLYQTVWRMGWE